LPAHGLDLVGVLPLVAVAVISLSVLRIGEHLIGLVDFLEPCLRLGVSRVHVGVVPPREATKRRTHLLIGGVALHPKHLVVVSCHAWIVAVIDINCE
jgi:hypothetical protein